MNINKILIVVFLSMMISPFLFAQEIVTNGRLSITVTNNGDGVEISSIKDNGTEVLNTTTSSDLFTLFIQDTDDTNTEEELIATANWNAVSIANNNGFCTIELTQPSNTNLPFDLKATITIRTENEKSFWDLAVTGLGVHHSLMDVTFPEINIKADGNDTFFYPLYSGQLTENPGTAIDYYDDPADIGDNSIGIYPRGWGTTMQFLSYYNANYGLYFGFHDPDASLKEFGVKNEDGGVKVLCKTPIPNKTTAGNDWETPGYFQLDLYNGDWYEAAQIYKNWASSLANYWPRETPDQAERKTAIGDIGLWLTTYMSDASVPAMEDYIETAINFFDFPIGVHIYEWNVFDHDHFYPLFFPEEEGMDGLITNLQNNTDAVIMPYINARLWDTGLGGNDQGDDITQVYYEFEGIKYSAKRSDLSTYTQPFRDNVFAVMCPTQIGWQDIIVDVADEVTNENRLNSQAIYLDMVAASSAAQCMDPTHGHPLGGGSYWRDGYQQMLENIHTVMPNDRFLTVEGGCDFIADEVDAFLVQGWTTTNQVPAWQAIYTGKVQLFGTKTGGDEYGKQEFYGKLAQGFAYGVQTGRQFLWLVINPDANPDKQMAANYVRTLGRLRYKIRDFMSYGSMKRPLSITGNIPSLTYDVWDWGGNRSIVTVNTPAIQTSTWQNGSEVVVVCANGRIQIPAGVAGGNLDFTFDFDAADYGLTGNITIQELTPTTDGAIEAIGSTFTKSVSLQNLEAVAYKITGEGVVSSPTIDPLSVAVFPNPTSNTFTIDLENIIEKVELFNNQGQLILTSFPEHKTVDITNLPKGVYLVTVYTEGKEYVAKVIKQ